MAAEADEACRDADPAEAPLLRVRAAAAREHAVSLAAVVQALTQRTSLSPLPMPLNDADGFDLRPNPLSARTPEDFVACLRAYRKWSGEPSLRAIAERSGSIVSHSKIRAVLGSDSLPNQASVRAIILGCGGTAEDQRTFVTAWRLLALAAPPEMSSADTGAEAVEGRPGGKLQLRPMPWGSSTRPPHEVQRAHDYSSRIFAELLRQMRAESGLTQEEMAAAAGISPRTVSDLERGINQTPRRATAELLADALHLTGAERARFMEAGQGRPQTS
jgi:DNA-binding XRE family transcriptional regulator